MLQVYEKYGITLKRINESHLEMVRNWRNSDFVRTGMLYQEHITAEMQEKWFHSINNDKNFYFIIQYNNEDVGVANIKNYEHNEGEPGLYLSDIRYTETPIASLAYFTLIDFAFNALELPKISIHVRRDNPDALKFNMFFGYKIIEEKCGADFYFLELAKASFLSNKKIHKLITYIDKKF